MRRILPLLLASLLLLAVPSFAGERPGGPSIREWVGRLSDADFGTRSGAKERLLALAEEDPEAVLRELPEEAEDLELRSLCASIRAEIERRRALRPFGGDGALAEAVTRFLEDPTVEAAERLAELALAGEASRKAAAGLFLRALEGEDAQGWGAAGVGLAKLRERAAAPRILSAAGKAKGPARLVLIASFMELGDASSAAGLVPLLSDEDLSVRILAAVGLSQLKADRFAHQVAALLSDPSPAVQQSAAGALSRFALEAWPEEPEALVERAKAWWEAHREDPAFAPER